jgi:hypothetical protein
MQKIIIGGLITIPLLFTIISFILNAILALLLTMTYSTLTNEQKIAYIFFEKIKNEDKLYLAHLYANDESEIGKYKIYGDQWRLDAGFIKMEYWANVLGVDSKYILNRFEGRYSNIHDENIKKHKSYLLESHNIIDTFSYFVDTKYGSSVYKDIKLNTKYTILKSQTGLIVRENKIGIKKQDTLLDKTKTIFGF